MSLNDPEKMREKLNTISPSFCLAKWYQVTLFLQNGYGSSCHHVKAQKISKRSIKKDPSRLHNTNKKIAVRKMMKKGVLPKECNYCWKIEKLKQLSDRHYKSSQQWAEPQFEKTTEQAYNKAVNPTNLEVTFNNNCNFKCSYCNPISSSSILKEQDTKGNWPVSNYPYKKWKRRILRNYMYKKDEFNPFIEAFWKWWPELSKDLKVFRITGGEPLLSPDTWKVIDHLIENPRPDLVFEINSNLGISSTLVNKLADKVNQLKGKVKFFALYTSIDNVGHRAEYIRNGLDYDLFLKNLHSYLSYINWNTGFNFMITMNALCIAEQTDLLKMILNLRRTYSNTLISLDTPYLRTPEYLSLQILPSHFKKHIEDSLLFMKSTENTPHGYTKYESQRLERVLMWMEAEKFTPSNLIRFRKDFYNFITEHDKRRNTDFNSCFPEFKEFLNDCKQLNKLSLNSIFHTVNSNIHNKLRTMADYIYK